MSKPKRPNAKPKRGKAPGEGGEDSVPGLGLPYLSDPKKFSQSVSWGITIQSGVKELFDLATSAEDDAERQRAVRALRDVSIIFLKKFKMECLQPWLAKLKTENAHLWNENRRMTKRHKAPLAKFVMREVAYFDQQFRMILDEMEKAKGIDPLLLPKFANEHCFQDEPGMQTSINLAVGAVWNCKVKPKGNGGVEKIMPPSVAWSFCRGDAKAYFEIVWPHLEAAWDRLSPDEKKQLPKNVGDTSAKKARQSPGVFRKECFNIVATLLDEYPFGVIPLQREAVQRILNKHCAAG